MIRRGGALGARGVAVVLATALMAIVMPGVAGADDATTISGVVTAGSDTPVPNTCVRWSTRFGATEVAAQTDADGRYTLTGVPANRPGVLMACGTGPIGDAGYAPMFHSGAATRSTASELTLSPGEHRTIDFGLRRNGSMSVIVRGLPSATGCLVSGSSGVSGWREAALRPTSQAGVYAADLFDVSELGNWPLPGQSWARLHCGGVWQGVGRIPGAGETVPFYQHGHPDHAEHPVFVIDHDPVGPVITPSPALGSIGWTSQPVTVSFTCTDAVSGVKYCPPPVTLGQGQAATVSALDESSLPTFLTVGPLPVDQTPPTIYVPGEQRAYRREETLRLGCEVVDDLSGMAWQVNQCPVWGTPASALELGDHEFWVMGGDAVGHSAGTIVRISIVK